MLRFCGKKLVTASENLKVIIEDQYLRLDKEIWQKGRDYFRNSGYYDNTKLQMIPILDAHGDIVCYGWQDMEANRELRMLKELKKNYDALQFRDIFPDVREVVVCGCNELAYCFVRYLEELKIPVSVKGRYWDKFGIENDKDIDFDDSNNMIVYAEHFGENRRDLFQKVIRSASPEFECIDRIYEANILAGNIKDTVGDFDDLLRKLKDKDVVIFGTDEKSQDAYDLLYSHNIDINFFAVDDIPGDVPRSLLGKDVRTFAEVLHNKENVVFVDVHNRSSAWGNKREELFDYYGYERNERFFLISDYTDIPFSNLIHVLKGKSVFLTGDESLCKILSEYLEDIEQGDIKLQYTKVLHEGMVKETDILCTVYLWHGPEASEQKAQFLGEYAISVPHTDYFSMDRVFVNIDQYRTKCVDKYSMKELVPKGILLNITETCNGNFFFKGILDGHPNILLLPYNFLNENLFVYCIRLSIEKSEDICRIFQLMLQENRKEEQIKDVFLYWNRFEESMVKWLSIKERFTAQELFMIFHIAYTEMMSGKEITDLSQKVIFFDPHWTLLTERYFLAKWLECENINTQIVTIHRDNVAWFTSTYEFHIGVDDEIELARGPIEWITQKKLDYKTEHTKCGQWKEIEVRFEELKLHPEEELLKVCRQLEIPWSKSLLCTTLFGKPSSLGPVKDFDLKPLINKHEAYWSEFDRFRLCLIMSPHQKKYGYSYEDCMKFSRTELWEMFLKEFRFQSKVQFGSAEEKSSYYLWAYESLRWQLYDNRKHAVINDIDPIFGPLILKEIMTEEMTRRNEINYLVEWIRSKDLLVFYGLGKDGEALWDCLDEAVRARLVVCDKNAESKEYLFRGKQVVSPKELCTKYGEYEILVTSSQYYREIIEELNNMGINVGRINYNTVKLWEKNIH